MKFLVFQHVPHEHPGLWNEFADKAGIELDIIELWKPYSIPHISEHQALIVMGGPMGVYEGLDVFPSRDDELACILQALEGNVPTIGFCLGSQLIAHALGADVHQNIVTGKHLKEIGYYDIHLTTKGKESPLFAEFPTDIKVLQWHGDAFDLPNEATLLATSERCTNQAFSYKNAFGCLFHFEFTPDMILKQIEIDEEWIHTDFEINEDELVRQTKELEPLMRRQSKRLFDNFVSLAKAHI